MFLIDLVDTMLEYIEDTNEISHDEAIEIFNDMTPGERVEVIEEIKDN